MTHVRVTSPAEYDRHEDIVRFVATIDGKSVNFMILPYALFIMREALDLKPMDSLQVYNLGGRLLAKVVEQVFVDGGADHNRAYLIGHQAVLQVTGRSYEGHSDAPKLWKP